MKRTGMVGILAALAVLMCLALPALGQNRGKGVEKGNARRLGQPARAQNLKREFAPQIIGRADSFIITGRILALRGQRLSVETPDGARLNFQLDEQTTLIEASELVSIATMDDIRLRLSDLRLADEVEVVAEHNGSRRLARIVTRTASGQPVARR